MKVILLKDVAKIGKKGDVKEVNQGHAMNFLIPRQLAKPVNDAQVRHIAEERVQQAEATAVRQDLAIKEMLTLKDKEIVLVEKANEKGSLFSQIHEKEILQAIKNQTGIVLPASSLALVHPIKETGAHKVEVTLFGISASVVVTVQAK